MYAAGLAFSAWFPSGSSMQSTVTACLAFLLVVVAMTVSDGIQGSSADLSADNTGRGVYEEEKKKKKMGD